MFDSATHRLRPQTRDRQSGRPTRGTALIVEDHLDSRELLSLVLRDLGYSVLEAVDGEEALQLAASKQFDLILTDLGLPGMDGLEFIKRVRALKQDQRDLKIVMVTAYDRTAYAKRAFNGGYDFLLSKPIDLDELKSVIESLQPHSKPESKTNRTQPYTRKRREAVPGCYKRDALTL